MAATENGVDALEAVRRHSPDIVLMDLRMPNMIEVETIQRLCETNPDTRAIVLTTYDDDDVCDATCAGARGYLVKAVPLAICTVHAGGSLLQPVVVQKLLDRLRPT